MKEQLRSIFEEYSRKLLDLLPNFMTAIVIFAIFWGLGVLLQKIIRGRARRHSQDPLLPKFTAIVVKWVFVLIGLTAGMHVMGFGGVMSSLIAGAGVSAIVLGFAFKDIAENFLAGIMLATNRPFRAGDIIEISGNKGVVKKLDLRTVHLRVADGRDIYIPNSMVIDNVLTNFTRDGLLRLDFPVGLDTECDLDKAKLIILKAIEGFDQILTDPAANMIVEEIGESSLNVRVLFWIDQFAEKDPDTVNTQRNIRGAVIQKVRDELLANGFTLPSVILEHKIYRSDEPIPIRVNPGN